MVPEGQSNVDQSATASTIPTQAWKIEPSPDPDICILRNTAGESPCPDDWTNRITAALRDMPGVQLVGAKRLHPQGQIFSMGEFIIHPKGFHHLGKGVPGSAYRFPEEVDVVTGGVFAVETAAFEAAGGITKLNEPLGAIELCLRLRSQGGRCVVVPQVVVTDTTSPLVSHASRQEFLKKWGFDWQAADLDAVRSRHADTGLLWNVRFHSQAMPFEKYIDRPAVHWSNYQQVDVYRKRADHLTQLVHQLCPPGKRVLDLGCGDGLFAHLFALRGAVVTGIDPELLAIDQARACTFNIAYPGVRPQFLVGSGQSLPLSNGSTDLVTLVDVIEHLPNPVRVLHEVSRVLQPDGMLLVTTPAWQYGTWSDAVYHVTEYTFEELIRQIEAIDDLSVANTGTIGGVYRDLIVIARKS